MTEKITICCVCKTFIGKDEPPTLKEMLKEGSGVKVSHGYCYEHYTEMMEAIREKTVERSKNTTTSNPLHIRR